MCIAGAADWTVTYDSCWSGKYLLFSLQCLIPMYAKLVTGCYNACILRRTNLCNCAWIGHGRRLDILWRHGSYHCHYFCRSCSSVSGNCCVCGLTCLQTHRLIEPPVSMKQSKLLHTSSHHISFSISKSYGNDNEKYRQERKAPHNTRTRARSAPTVIFWRLPLRGMLCVRTGRFCCNRNLSRDHLFGNALPLQMQQNSTATQGGWQLPGHFLPLFDHLQRSSRVSLACSAKITQPTKFEQSLDSKHLHQKLFQTPKSPMCRNPGSWSWVKKDLLFISKAQPSHLSDICVRAQMSLDSLSDHHTTESNSFLYTEEKTTFLITPVASNAGVLSGSDDASSHASRWQNGRIGN